jgi:hypothetical protein
VSETLALLHNPQALVANASSWLNSQVHLEHVPDVFERILSQHAKHAPFRCPNMVKGIDTSKNPIWTFFGFSPKTGDYPNTYDLTGYDEAGTALIALSKT